MADTMIDMPKGVVEMQVGMTDSSLNAHVNVRWADDRRISQNICVVALPGEHYPEIPDVVLKECRKVAARLIARQRDFRP